MFSRWLELGSGLAGGILGLLLVTFVLLGPVYQTMSSSCTYSPAGTSCSTQTGTGTLAQVNNGYTPLALLFLGIFSLALLGLIANTLLHWRSGSILWRRCLYCNTGLLVIVAVLGLDLWPLVAPSLLLALVAAIAASRY